MELAQETKSKNSKRFTSDLNKTYFIICLLSVSIIGTVSYGFYLGINMSAKYAPLVDAAMEAKLAITTAHLWFEEIISGRPAGRDRFCLG